MKPEDIRVGRSYTNGKETRTVTEINFFNGKTTPKYRLVSYETNNRVYVMTIKEFAKWAMKEYTIDDM